MSRTSAGAGSSSRCSLRRSVSRPRFRCLSRWRSELPVIRALSVAYIELVRGVPLISLLFMASVMLPLFLPSGMTVDKLARAQIALILFAAAYLAEVVRGGLQAITRGQYEAAA